MYNINYSIKLSTYYSLITWVGVAFFYASCQHGTGNGGNEKTDTSQVSAAGISFNNDTNTRIFAGYIALKEALVKSDADLAGRAANDLAEELNTVEGCENTAVLTLQIANSNDLSLQRSAFSTVSDDLIALFQHAGISAGAVYVIHCPMFNNNEGADWLSASSEIKNPYYGDSMLTCGTVKEEIK